MSTETSKRTGLKPEHLASKWNVSIGQAEDTMNVTTQRAVRHMANPALSSQFKTNDRLFQFNGMQHTVFTDTMKSTVKSTRQNQFAQVCCADFQWIQSCPMKKESEAHHTSSTMLKDVGIPVKMVMDDAKTQVQGQFRKKLKEADCRVKSLSLIHI